jgi:hypothetical protein
VSAEHGRVVTTDRLSSDDRAVRFVGAPAPDPKAIRDQGLWAPRGLGQTVWRRALY